MASDGGGSTELGPKAEFTKIARRHEAEQTPHAPETQMQQARREPTTPVPDPFDGLEDLTRQVSVARMYKAKHLFVELHEFKHDHWHETHRWNHGLQEDLVVKTSSMGEDGRLHGHGSWGRPHLPSVSLDGLADLRNALMPCAVVLDLNVNAEVAFQSIVNVLMNQFVKLNLVKQSDRHAAEIEWLSRLRQSGIVAREDGGTARLSASAATTDWHSQISSASIVEETAGTADFEREVSLDSALNSDDPLKADAEEEALHILVDEAPWLNTELVAFIRLTHPVNLGFEEEAMCCLPCCRFLAMILGPSAEGEAEAAVTHHRHVDMGLALAALLQDDAVVNAGYQAKMPEQFVDIVFDHVKHLRLMPQTSRPTEQGIKRRAQKIYDEMADVKGDTRKKLLRSQTSKWSHKQRGIFDEGFSISSVVRLMERFALPLLAGITLALIAKNLYPVTYDTWAGYGAAYIPDGQAPEEDAHRRLGGGGGHRPTMFGLSVKGHPMTVHFLVNDIFMCLFFGLATKEISEALQPGGSLFPPTRSTVNVMCATAGGVFGPIIVYLASLKLFEVMGLLDPQYTFADYAIGWGVPTATDISIAWVTALLVFGSGHPAINYLLLLAVVDDGIGLLIIAFAYPDPENPLKPQWLGLVLVAMLIAFILRTLKCSLWQAYIVLAGPVAWAGLLFASLHPSLALVFVVPFMPLKITDENVFSMGSEGQKKHKHHHAPLHEFEEACKSFVDFGVLFAFGAVNAGVKMDSVGVLTGTMLLALVVGKTLGIFLAAKIASVCHFPPPAGMNDAAIVTVGFIASSGLTVALFISGEAFSASPLLAAQAKMGALMSIFAAFLSIFLGKVVKKCNPNIFKVPKQVVSGQPAVQDLQGDNEDMLLEDVIVENTVQNIRTIHKAQKHVEKKAKMKRHEAISQQRNQQKDLVRNLTSDSMLPTLSDTVGGRGPFSSRSLPAVPNGNGDATPAEEGRLPSTIKGTNGVHKDGANKKDASSGAQPIQELEL
eukprot:TRINITY_DN34032_c0_g1_i1.p1 TRINITY_DN34032_c0_g1~~TRINITY_DN34032_c0_g1_i1.p1  ORF type:complete len:1001 (+),score=162.92 TRINITY_DN34032_c0_g1_i1:194-3196(+)